MKDMIFVKKIIALFKTICAKWNDLAKEKQMMLAGGMIAALVVVIVCCVFVADWGKSKDTLGQGDTQDTDATYFEEPLLTEETFFTEESVITELTEPTEVIEPIHVSITTTSIERDLKIKFVDEHNDLVKGQHFVVTITKDAQQTGVEHSDDNMNGIIHIQSLEPGKYTVTLHEMEGVTITQNPITANVKEKIVYEKVEIENEIVDESEIDVSVEDTIQKDVIVEEEIKDTLPLLEKSVTTTVVEKESVDFGNFPDAVVSEEKNELTLTNEQTLAKVFLSKEIILYPFGKDTATSCDLGLELEDENAIITDVAWKIDKEGVLEHTVSEDKKTINIVAKTVETATITAVVSYKSDEQNTISTGEIFCQVSVNDYTDSKTQIKDVDGNLLFLDNEAKKIATPKNYSAATKFYTNPKYTGWQTLNEYTYYYKADNTPATGKQVIGGVTYEFHEDGTLKESEQSVGIDVSKWNKNIDWKAVANAGIDFAIIRCAYRGYSTGVIVEDPYFKQNIKGATENGIKVGVYFFTQAITEAEAVEEASTAIALVEGYKLHFPIFIDTEGIEGAEGRADNLNKADRTSIVRAFCETVRNAGYKPGIYASKYWYYDNLDTSKLSTYNIWVAQYNTECNYNGRYDMWQHTSSGSVPGITGRVDMNICYTKY